VCAEEHVAKLPPHREAVFRTDSATINGRDNLLAQVRDTPEGTVTYVDCLSADYSASALDELLVAGVLTHISAGILGSRRVVLRNVSAGTLDELRFLLERVKGRKLAVLAEPSTGTMMALIGDIGAKLRQTWEAVQGSSVSAPETAERFGISPNAAHNRLNELERLGLVWRAEPDGSLAAEAHVRWRAVP